MGRSIKSIQFLYNYPFFSSREANKSPDLFIMSEIQLKASVRI